MRVVRCDVLLSCMSSMLGSSGAGAGLRLIFFGLPCLGFRALERFPMLGNVAANPKVSVHRKSGNKLANFS